MRSFTFGVKDHGNDNLEVVLENHQLSDDGTPAERLILSLAISKLVGLADAVSKGCQSAVKQHYEKPSADVMKEVDKFFGRT